MLNCCPFANTGEYLKNFVYILLDEWYGYTLPQNEEAII